ncbi:MAG: peptidylprolyl isomerase [Paraclostridium sp.]
MRKIISIIMVISLGIITTACSSKGPVAVVNGNEISLLDFEKTAATYKESVQKLYGESLWEQEISDGVKYKDELKKGILTQMVQEELVYEEAKKENLEAKKEEVESKFKELKASIEKDKDYAKFLSDNDIDEEFLKSQLKKDLSIQNYKAKFDKDTKIPEDDIKTYYEENKDKYKEDKVKASHILISTVDEKTEKAMTETKKKEAKKKAEEIYKKVKDGEDFAKLAKEYSEDEYSATNGGDLGFFEKGKMVPEFELAAFSLDKGKISEIIETQYGYHIIKVTDKIYKQYSYDEVKDKIKEVLLYQKYTEKVKELESSATIEKNEKEVIKTKI